MTRTLKETIDKSVTGLRSSLARKYFQELLRMVYVYHKIKMQPHGNIKTSSLHISDKGSLVLDKSVDEAHLKEEDIDSVRYLECETLR